MNHTSRTVSISEPLWTALETMSREMGVDRDVLVNQAIFSLARQFGFITPTQVSLLDGATSAPPRAVAPVVALQAAPPPQPEHPTRVEVVALASEGTRGPDSETPPTSTSDTVAASPEVAALDEAEPSATEALLSALRPEPEVVTPPVDVEALRQGVAARIRDILADVDRLVEPVDERLGDEEDEDVSEDEEDSSEDESAPDEDAGSDDEEDEARTGDQELGDDASDDALIGDDEDSPSEGGGLAAPRPKPPAPVETTIVVKTTSGVPLHVKLDDSEPVRVARERFIIGRGAHCDLVVKSARVSREHAVVVQEGAEFFIEDLTSSNGTWYDNTRIARRLVSDGDEYLLGGIRVTFSLG